MYSPLSPRKSAKNSPRKPLLSPSELTPFSFSSDNLHLYDDDSLLVQQGGATAMVNESGKVPMSISLSQPRTPTSSSVPKFGFLNYPASAPGGRSYSLNGSLIGSLSSGTGVREVDDTIRDLRKENFNLKLRIYFLEERLGSSSRWSSAQSGSREELLQSNLELKVQCESLKYDVKEKTELLAEAGKALDQMETKMANMASEREEERRSLEEKLCQLEDLPEQLGGSFEADDDHLLHEVEQELRGGVSRTKPAERGCQTEVVKHVLGVVHEEKDVEHLASKVEDLENSVEQLSIVINDTEACLQEAQQKASTLETELAKRDAHIENLAKQSRLKAEAAVKAQKELADLATKATDQAEESEAKVKACNAEKESLMNKFCQEKQELLADLKRLQDLINEKDQELRALATELADKSAQLEVLKELQACDNKPDPKANNSSCCSSPDGAYKIVHQCVPTAGLQAEAEAHQQTATDIHLKFKSFQVVTQTLHIEPSAEVSESNREMEKLRKEVKKLREYARLSVQDRKVLIHKIGTLKDKVHETSSRKSASPLRQLTPTSCTASQTATVQCNLLENKNYWLRFAKLQQKLVKFGEAADLMKSQLEVICDVLEPAVTQIDNKNIGATLQNMIKSSQNLLVNIGQTLDEVKAAPDETDGEIEQDRCPTSMSNQSLPDPSEMEIPEHPKDVTIKHLKEELVSKEQCLEEKLNHLRALADQVEQKNKVIREQAEELDEYRMKLLHFKSAEEHQQHQQRTPPQRKKGKQAAMAPTPSGQEEEVVQSPIAGSDEGDSWSEPDVDASRKRMGLSQHVLSLIEKTGALNRQRRADSSELDDQRLKRFYSLDYTEPDFSDTLSSKELVTLVDPKSTNSDETPYQCQNFNCLISNLQEFSRIMDELSYQLDVSQTYSEEMSSSDEDFESGMRHESFQKETDYDEAPLDFCPSCAKSLPLELEDCLQRWKMLLFSSNASLRKLRTLCSSLKKRLNRSHSMITDKNRHITQLEEAVKGLGAKIESATDEAERKTRDLAELHLKLNENYRLVAELSSDNLRLSTEKAAAEQLLDEVKHEQGLLKSDLGKAQKMIEDSMMNASSSGVDVWSTRQPQRQSSPETSASSFDFFPPNSPSVNSRNNHKRRGSIPPPRGRQKSNRSKWKTNACGASSDYASETSPRKRSHSRPSTALASDVSSPDLGVDLGSDPFSSLERSNGLAASSSSSSKQSMAAILEENKRLKQDKERLSEKLSQSKGALRETLDRLHKKDASTMSPLPSRRIFSSAVAAAVSSNQPPPSLKEEFLAFSKSNRFKTGKKKATSDKK